MKFYLIILILVLNLSSFSQYVYFGYSETDSKLQSKDIIIVNIPLHMNGRFHESDAIYNLIDFLNKDTTFNFRIEINLFWGSSEFNLDYTKDLSINLDAILKKEVNKTNYEIYYIGSENPIFLDKKSTNYKMLNTRIEILIE